MDFKKKAINKTNIYSYVCIAMECQTEFVFGKYLVIEGGSNSGGSGKGDGVGIFCFILKRKYMI